ncbi:hypothetical protein [Lentilactobacillus parabuchneri]|uniref:hypothetical protein n=1 Tax=Lentilactobacillus parabuchneri TaxID=152331 RepID=UPI0009474178|nr:hypothetical protein [Lentilactobacillus parabuchneri]APR08778.1 hypothetical protein FAM21731_02659 [Lentilactobacillus parabuchneri]ORN00234.1 hypothetical protein FAM21829_02655 [Lentilactobacillus parabuchneri]
MHTIKGTKQFIRQFNFFEKKGFNPTKCSIINHLYDRMESSIKRPLDYFDKDKKAFFIIYSNEQMARDINVSVRTVANYMAELADEQWITRYNTPTNSTYRIFIPRFATASSPFWYTPRKFCWGGWKKFLPNQTFNHTLTYKTINTDNTQNGLNSAIFTSSPKSGPQTVANTPQPGETNGQPTSKQPKTSQQPVLNDMAINIIADQLIHQGGLPEQAVSIMKALSFGNADKLYNYGGLIYKAKKAVYKNHREVKDIGLALSLEQNTDMRDSLAENLRRILFTANKKTANPVGVEKYIMVSLKNYFEECGDKFLQELHYDPANYFENSNTPAYA